MEKPGLSNWLKSILGEQAAIKTMTPLMGGMSSRMYRIDVSGRQALVARQIVDQEWLAQHTDLVRHEAGSLRVASKIALPTPELIAFDETGEQAGHPTVLMTCLEGRVDLQPQNQQVWLEGLAQTLKAIHSADLNLPWHYFTYNQVADLKIPEWSQHPGLWKRAFAILWDGPPQADNCLIHRDYHPANVLWHQSQVSGVVDWINACMGPIGVDVGHCRLNLALLYGADWADRFLNQYRTLMGKAFSYHPYWDLLTLIEFLPGPPEVYKGWLDLGVTQLTDGLMAERMDRYLVSIMKAYGIDAG